MNKPLQSGSRLFDQEGIRGFDQKRIQRACRARPRRRAHAARHSRRVRAFARRREPGVPRARRQGARGRGAGDARRVHGPFPLPRGERRHHGRRPVVALRPPFLRAPQRRAQGARRSARRAPDPPAQGSGHRRHHRGGRLHEGAVLLPGRRLRRGHRRERGLRHAQQQLHHPQGGRAAGQHLHLLVGRLFHGKPLRALRVRSLLRRCVRAGPHERILPGHQGVGAAHRGRASGRARRVGHAGARLLGPSVLASVHDAAGRGIRPARHRAQAVGRPLRRARQAAAHGHAPVRPRRHMGIRLAR